MDFNVIRGMVYKKKKKRRRRRSAKVEGTGYTREIHGRKNKNTSAGAGWRGEVYDADVTVCNDALNARVYLKL